MAKRLCREFDTRVESGVTAGRCDDHNNAIHYDDFVAGFQPRITLSTSTAIPHEDAPRWVNSCVGSGEGWGHWGFWGSFDCQT